MRAAKIFLSSLLACCGASVVTCSVAYAVLFGWRHVGSVLAEIIIFGGFLAVLGTFIVAPIALAVRRPKWAIAIGATIIAVIVGFAYHYLSVVEA